MSNHRTQPNAKPLFLLLVNASETVYESPHMIFAVPAWQVLKIIFNRVKEWRVLRVNIQFSVVLNTLYIRQRHFKVPYDRVPSFGCEMLVSKRILADTSNLVSAVKHIVTEQIVLFKKLLNLHEIRVCSNNSCSIIHVVFHIVI